MVYVKTETIYTLYSCENITSLFKDVKHGLVEATKFN